MASLKIRNAKQWAPYGFKKYSIALGVFGIAFGARYMFHTVISNQLPFTFFIVAIIVTEFYCGLMPALMTLLLSVPVGAYFFIPPFKQFDGVTRTDIFTIAGILSITLLAILLIEQLRRSQYQARLLGEVAQSRYEMLLHVDNARQVAERDVQQGYALAQSIIQMIPHVWYLAQPKTGFHYLNQALLNEVTSICATRLVTQSKGDLQSIELHSSALLNMLHPDDRGFMSDHLNQRSLAEPQCCLIQFRLMQKDGSDQTYSSVYRLSDSNDGPLISLENLALLSVDQEQTHHA